MRPEIRIEFDPHREMEPVGLPLSKSVALRVMTLNAVASRLSGAVAIIPELPDAEDVKGMMRAMAYYDRAVKCPPAISISDNSTSDEEQVDKIRNYRVNIGEGGAPFRFFTALAASTPGIDLTLLTSKPLIRRPHAILLDTLREAGADIRSLRRPGRPPLRIIGRKLAPSSLTMDPGISSQYISALMMAAPLWEHGLTLDFNGEQPVSLPYLRMTADAMRRFGCEVAVADESIRIAPGICCPPDKFDIPTDWSAASYFYELALLLPGREIPLSDLTVASDSMQGDADCQQIFGKLGVETIYNSDGSVRLRYSDTAMSGQTIELNLNGTPDLAPALAVGFCLAGVRFRFVGVAHLRHKETDRMAALACELRKLGYVLFTSDEEMGWNGECCQADSEPLITTYSDHRMAMAFAPAAIRFPGLRIERPAVVGKSFPRYWEMLRRLGFNIE